MFPNQQPFQHPGSPSSYREFVPAAQQQYPAQHAPMEDPNAQNKGYYYLYYREDEPLRHPDEFPSPIYFAVYWDSLPKQARYIITQTDVYDRFITERWNYDADQLEYDEIDPVRPTLVRGMYFEELAEDVFAMFEKQKEEKEKAEKEKAAVAPAGAATTGPVPARSAAVPVVAPPGTVPPAGTVPA